MSIDKVSTLKIKILDSGGNLIPGSCQGEVTPAPFVVTAKSDFARSGSTNINTELDAPEGDVSIKAKNMESQIDLKYIYEQNASRITINSSDAISKSRRGKVIDNDDSTFWQAPIIPSQKVHILPYWMMDLGQIYDITKIQLIFANNLFAVQYSADSTNGSNGAWSDLVVDTAAIGNPSGQLISARMRYIKIISTNPSDPTSADIINELRLYRAVAYSTYISAPTQFDSGLNAQNVKHIKQWVSLQPSEEDSTSAGADYNGTKILYSYRGSNNADVASPTWGAWTALVDYTGTALSLSSMGQYRFIQVRIDFISTADNKSPVLHDFTLNYKICATGGGSTNFSLAVSITSSKLSYDSPNIAKYRDTDSFGSTSYLSMSTYNYNPLSVSTSHSAGLEWDDYILSVAASTGYYIISVGSAVFSNGMPIIHLEPGDAKNVDLYVTKDANYARIRSIAPVAARCNTQTTVNISGEVLKSNSIIQLKKDNSVINSSNFYYIDDKNIQADFDIPSGSAGIWDVVVTNPGTSTGDTITTQFKGFSITD